MANQCAFYYSAAQSHEPKLNLKRQLSLALYGQKPSDEKLYFFWVDQLPRENYKDWFLKKFPGLGSYTPFLPTDFSTHGIVRYRSRPTLLFDDLSEDPIIGSKKIETAEWIREQSSIVLRAFLGNYKGKTSPSIIAAIDDLHTLLTDVSNDRLGFGFVATGPPEKGGIVLGTLRIFSGGQDFSDSHPLLPMEQSFLKDGVNPDTSYRLAKLRRSHPGKSLFEIGSHSINIPENKDPKLAERVRTIIDLFYLRYYLSRIDDDAIFFSHVLNPIVARKNGIRYGLRTVEKVTVPGQKEIERIQEATAKTIKQRLAESYGIDKTQLPDYIKLQFDPESNLDSNFEF